MPLISSPQSVQTQGVQSIIASNATFTSGGVTFSGLGAATVQTAAAQRVDINVPVQSVQVVQSAIAASNTTYTSGLVTITGVGGGVTVSSNTGQRIDISVAAQSVQVVQSAIAASNTTYTSGLVTITGVGGGVTVSSNTGQRIDISVAAQSVQIVQSAIAASNTTYTSGLVVLTGSNMVTVKSSGAGQTIIIDATQSVQTQNVVDVSLSGNTAGVMALISSGTLNLAGGNNITLSQNGQSVTISGAAAAGAQTAISGVAASNTTYTSGTITISGVGGGVTINSNTGQRVDVSVAAQTVQTQNAVDVTISGNTSGALALVSSGTMTLAGGNNITLSQAGNAITISAANAGGAQTGISSIAASNTTYTSGGITITGSNMVTVRSTTGQGIVIDATQSVQVVQSAIAASNTTYTSGLVVFTGSNAATVKSSGAGQTVIIDVSQSVQVVQSAIAATNTTYTSGLVVFTGSNMITVKSSGAGQTVILDATQSVQTQGQMSMGVSTGGNTQGNTGVSGTRIVLVGTSNITLSQQTDANGATISISGPNAGAGGGVNIAASNTTYTSGTVVFSASDSYRSAISIASVGAQSVIVSDAGPQLAYWERNRPAGTLAGSMDVVNRMTLFPLDVPGFGNRFEGRITASVFRVPVKYLQSSSSAISQALSSTMRVFVYTRNSDSLSLLNSGSMSFGNTVATSNNSIHWNGIFALDMSSSQWSVRPDFLYGGEYYIGLHFQSHQTLGVAGGGPFPVVVGNTDTTASQFQIATAGTAGGTNLNGRPFLGQVSMTATNQIRTTIVMSQVEYSGATKAFEPYIAMYESTQFSS